MKNDIKNIEEGTLVIILGLSGSGKTVLAKKLTEKYEGMINVSNDKWRNILCGNEANQTRNDEVYEKVNEEIENSLKENKRVVMDATNLYKVSREKLYEIARKNNNPILVLFLNVPLEEAIERNNIRDRKVPIEIIERQFDRMKQTRIDIEEELDKDCIVDITIIPNKNLEVLEH